MVLSGRPIRPGCIVAVAVIAIAALALAVLGYREATAAPIVRRLTIEVPNYPATAAPIRLALFSDLHVRGPDMPPARVARIVDQVNALHPDLVVVAGDFIGHSWIGTQYSFAEATRPLRQLRAKLGVYAVLGNNDFYATPGKIDYRAETFVKTLGEAGVQVLMNEARRVGPVALGGLDGRLAHSQPTIEEARLGTYAAMARTPGVKVLVGHRPDEFAKAPQFVSLVLAGHTHCGQIAVPLVGPLVTGSDYGRKYACGAYRVGSRVLVVTAGLGTSHLPLRIGAPPDLWLITIQGAQRSPHQS